MKHTAAPKTRAASPLVSAAALESALDAGAGTVLLDARFDLSDPHAGRRAYAQGHLPDAQYADLDRDLSGPKAAPGPAFTGRHPLPARDVFAATVGRWGIAPATCVVALDAQNSAYAARLWWLLRWLGHSRVWVLDGGIAAWLAAGGTLTTEPAIAQPRAAYPHRRVVMPTMDAARVAAVLGRAPVIDARAPERYRGDAEPLDAVAGHIPGSVNRPFKDNLEADGAHFKPAARLAEEFAALYGGASAAGSVHLCGSGVTACHNLLAMEAAGLPGATLYPGSWSEWCADPARPVARGA